MTPNIKIQASIQLKLVLLLAFIFYNNSTHSQTSSIFYLEPNFSIGFQSGEKWSHSFAIANRTLLSENYNGEQLTEAKNEHIDLDHYTKYKMNASTAFSLGFRYRFRELFDENRYDEFRFIEQIDLSHPDSALELGHRFRVEQRFKYIITEHRFRYKFGGSKDLNEVFALGLSTEALLTLANGVKPSLEQRFVLKLSNTSINDIELSVALDYEMADYNNQLVNEFFILTGIALDL